MQEERYMRMLKMVIAGVATAATLALTVGVAVADPINAKTGKTIEPRACDVVGAGSNTIEYLMSQYSLNYNKALLKAHKGISQTQSCAKESRPFFYSWDALQNSAASSSPLIALKKGCAKIERPNGSSAGIADLTNVKVKDPSNHKSYPCLDFARSSRASKSTDPTNVTFVPLALDNVTYATVKGGNAPANLTTADLKKIYLCTATTWNQVGGRSTATIHPLLPQSGSGTLAFFEAAIGVTTPGSCVVQPATLEENEGVNAVFRGPNAKNLLIPFSAGKWVAQAYHSAACSRSGCGTDSSGVTILCKKPTKTQNTYGCDVNGPMVLNSINSTSPIVGKGSKTVLSSKFTIGFVRALYAVVRATHAIPKNMNAFFGRYNKKTNPNTICSPTNQKTIIPDYGFRANPACGVPGAF
jgi:ABC-type phosphate transport system substrate-binding protein